MPSSVRDARLEAMTASTVANPSPGAAKRSRASSHRQLRIMREVDADGDGGIKRAAIGRDVLAVAVEELGILHPGRRWPPDGIAPTAGQPAFPQTTRPRVRPTTSLQAT